MATTLRRYLWLLAIFALSAQAEFQNLELARIQLIDGGDIFDTHIEGERPHGRLVVETDERNVMRGLDFDAWFRGDDQPLVSDVVVVLDYTSNGARYEVMSLLNNAQYFIYLLRRAPVDSDYDPATIIQLNLGEGVWAILDYRYQN